MDKAQQLLTDELSARQTQAVALLRVCFPPLSKLTREALILSPAWRPWSAVESATQFDYIPVTLSKSSISSLSSRRYPPAKVVARNSTLLLRLLPGINEVTRRQAAYSRATLLKTSLKIL